VRDSPLLYLTPAATGATAVPETCVPAGFTPIAISIVVSATLTVLGAVTVFLGTLGLGADCGVGISICDPIVSSKTIARSQGGGPHKTQQCSSHHSTHYFTF
ncbi:MAG: hypothetical protein ACRCSI_09255, partial [Eubacterium aggregans]